jgi:predicted nucleotidyltransferase
MEQPQSIRGRTVAVVTERLDDRTRITIETAVERLAAAADPRQIILFGSHARGQENEGGDLDFLVIVSGEVNRYAGMVRLRRAIGSIGMPVDVLVYSEEEVRRRGARPGSALYAAQREGQVLYDNSDG